MQRHQRDDQSPAWFRSELSAADAEEVLQDKREGCFVARESYGSPGDFALSIKVKDSVQHVLVRTDRENGSCNIFSMFDVERFPSLEEMVVYYQHTPLHFNQLNKDVLLTHGIGLDDAEYCGTFEEETNQFSKTSVDFTALGFEHEAVILHEIMKSDCIILAIGHSELSVNGEMVESREGNVACVVKDKAKKGFFIRIIDLKEQCVVSDKRIDKRFQYDNPKPLVMSYISDAEDERAIAPSIFASPMMSPESIEAFLRGLTAIGFGNDEEATEFQNEVDGCIKHALDRETRKRAESKAKQMAGKEGNEVTSVNPSRHWLKASDFNIDNIPNEWQELFELSGVKRQDLEDVGTLQFILDYVASQGGLSVGPTSPTGKLVQEKRQPRQPRQPSSMEASHMGLDMTDSQLGPDAVVGTVRRRFGSRARSARHERRTFLAQQLNKRLTQISTLS